MLKAVIFCLTAVFFGYLALENAWSKKCRRTLRHVVYVNGTRGKSSVARLIDAGLRGGGLRVFCKTTGTLPMVIDSEGVERPILRRGGANIKEQLTILRKAAGERAEVLVMECMAVDPHYQSVSQHRMVKADIGVITNVRQDHTDVMGSTLPQIADALSNTIPKNGVLFTAEQSQLERLRQNAAPLGCEVVGISPEEGLPEFDFAENISLALAVCAHLGVERQTALAGMERFYQRDPYALSLHRLGEGALFVNGMSINDPQSTEQVYRMLDERFLFEKRHVILLINSRSDRVFRTKQMVELAARLKPNAVWLLGTGGWAVRRELCKKMPALPQVKLFAKAKEFDFTALGAQDVVFAAGNIAAQGKALMERVWREGSTDV